MALRNNYKRSPFHMMTEEDRSKCQKIIGVRTLFVHAFAAWYT